MDQTRSNETLRGFLTRREAELLGEVDALRAQLAPREKELADIRRAKTTLGIANIEPTCRQQDRDAAYRMLAIALRKTVPAEMKIKDLIMRTLVDHFHGGATPAEIGDYIRDTYGRDIEPGSIRPNLARLREAGLIVHDGLASRWILDPAAIGTIMLLYREAEGSNNSSGDLLSMAAKLAWTEEDAAACQEREANDRAGIHQEDFNTWADRRTREKLDLADGQVEPPVRG
jgi:hypothetical protein